MNTKNKRRRIHPILPVLGLMIYLFPACSPLEGDPSSQGKDPLVRIIMESGVSSATVSIQVLVEGADGEAVTGANVVVLNSSGVARRLTFDSDRYCFAGTAPVSTDHKYLVEVQSRLMDKTYSSLMEHRFLQTAPRLTALRDASGNDALSGKPLKAGEAIELIWDSVPEATVYQISVTKASASVHTATSSVAAYTLPGDLLKDTGAYMVKVTAQYIAGDPLLQKQMFYSFSEKAGATQLFDLQSLP